jgi:hypothetical protein
VYTFSPNGRAAGAALSVGSEVAMRDHQEWCLGDAQLTARSMAEVVAREGELTHEALVAAGEQYRLAQEGANPHG